MFRERIEETPLDNEKSAAFFDRKIFSLGGWSGDVSFLSTLRALLYDKLADDEKLVLTTFQHYYHENDFLENITSVIRDRDTALYNNMFTFDIHEYLGCNKPEEFDLAKLEEELPDGWKRLNKVTELFRKYFPVYCLINNDIKSVILIVFDLDYKKYHFIQCAAVGMFPWYYSPTNIDEDRMELIYSLREKTKDRYLNALNRIANKLDFRVEYIKAKLKGFEQFFEQRTLEQTKNRIQNYHNNISTLENDIRGYMQDIREAEIVLAGLLQKIESMDDNSEMMNYFIANKNLDLIRCQNGNLDYICKNYIFNWDEDVMERSLENPTSYFYRNRENKPSNELFKKLLYAIFVDRTIKIKTCAAFRLSINDMSVTARGGYGFGSEYVSYMPNPHLNKYECLGNYRQIFRDCMKNADYLRAVEQSVMATGSLNPGDTTVMDYFLNKLLLDSNRTLELPDGSMVNAREATKWLVAQEKGTEGDVDEQGN